MVMDLGRIVQAVKDIYQTMAVTRTCSGTMLGGWGSTCDVDADSVCAGLSHERTPPSEGTCHLSGTCSGSGTACEGNDCYQLEFRDSPLEGDCDPNGWKCDLVVSLGEDCDVSGPRGDRVVIRGGSLIIRGQLVQAPADVSARSPDICTYCDGVGRTSTTACNTCDGAGLCVACDGAGEVVVACNTCGGTSRPWGHLTAGGVRVDTTCGQCDGSGTNAMDCKVCSGHGACRTCGGAGHLGGEPCTHCGGTGLASGAGGVSTPAAPTAPVAPRTRAPVFVSRWDTQSPLVFQPMATNELITEARFEFMDPGGRVYGGKDFTVTISPGPLFVEPKPAVQFVVAGTNRVPADAYLAVDDRSVTVPARSLADRLGAPPDEIMHGVFQQGIWVTNGSLQQADALANFAGVVAASRLPERGQARCNAEFSAALNAFVNFKPGASAGGSAAGPAVAGGAVAGAGAGGAEGGGGDEPTGLGGVIRLVGELFGFLTAPLRGQGFGCNTTQDLNASLGDPAEESATMPGVAELETGEESERGAGAPRGSSGPGPTPPVDELEQGEESEEPDEPEDTGGEDPDSTGVPH